MHKIIFNKIEYLSYCVFFYLRIFFCDEYHISSIDAIGNYYTCCSLTSFVLFSISHMLYLEVTMSCSSMILNPFVDTK